MRITRCMQLSLILGICLMLIAVLVMPATASAVDETNEIDPQLLPDSSFIYDTSIVDLSLADSYYDNQRVRVTGEVVGDRRQTFEDPGNSWITVTDPSFEVNNTIELHMSDEQASRIDTYGSYNSQGSVISVQGIFHLVCSEHGGTSDVHVETMTVASRGKKIVYPFQWESFIPGAVALVAGGILMGILWYVRERRR